jgi:hypothetical protein
VGERVATLLLEEWEDDIHTPKMGTWESTRTFETSKLDCKGQNTLHWGVLYIIGKKLSKCRCWKWAHTSHLDIYSISYGKKKGQESNWQFDSRPLKVRIDPTLVREGEVRDVVEKLLMRATSLLLTSPPSKVWAESYKSTKWRESIVLYSSLGVSRQKTIRM